MTLCESYTAVDGTILRQYDKVIAQIFFYHRFKYNFRYQESWCVLRVGYADLIWLPVIYGRDTRYQYAADTSLILRYRVLMVPADNSHRYLRQK